MILVVALLVAQPAISRTLFDEIAVEGLAKVAGRARLHRVDGTFVDVALPLPADTAAAGAEDRQATFLVDFDEPDVKALVASLPRPQTAEQLRAFVHAHITRKNRMRLLDPASMVARRKEGDCTEHAVLLAALMRAFDHTSRVMTGIVLIEQQGRVLAFGHAWTERRTPEGWQVADAALPPELSRHYVPIIRLPEGTGVKPNLAGILEFTKIELR